MNTNNQADHIIDNVFGVIANPPSLPEYLSASATVHGVAYTGKLYPSGVEMVTMTAEQFEQLVSDAAAAGVDVASGAEYRERYA